MPDKNKDAGEVRILEVEGYVWAIRQELLPALAAMSSRTVELEVPIDTEAASSAVRLAAPPTNGVATVPLKGVLMPVGGGILSLLFGDLDPLKTFRAQLAAAVQDPEVGTIVMDVDSPGGVVDGIPETAAAIRQARASKPIIAVANVLAASAAYWLASQANEVVVTPSGQVGSIGVYQIHRDLSAALADAGIAPTIVSAGKYKVEGNPMEPLTDEARQAMQNQVNDFYNLFTADVAKGRKVSVGDVKEGYGEGRTLTAKRAVQAGLADRVDTLEGTVSKLAKGYRPGQGSSARAEEFETGEQPGETEAVPVAVQYSDEERTAINDLRFALAFNDDKED